nr:hypothetical protein BaRGS_020078 [Batillaria attramentaria]
MDDMALEGESSGLGGKLPLGQILDSSAEGAKKDDFYVVVAACSDDEDKGADKEVPSAREGMVTEAGDNSVSADVVTQAQNDTSADDDFVIMYADDDGSTVADDTDGVAVTDRQGSANGVRDDSTGPATMETDNSSYRSLVAILDNLENPALPGCVGQSVATTVGAPLTSLPAALSSMNSFTAQPVLDTIVAQPGFFTPPRIGDTDLAPQVVTAGNLTTDASSALETSDSAFNQTSVSATDVVVPDVPEVFEEGEPVDSGASTFLSQVRFFAGRTWAVRGEKLKEAKHRKSIPDDLINTDDSDVDSSTGPRKGVPQKGRGRGQGSSIAGKGSGDNRPESLTKSVGDVMSYLFGENLVGQCPAGFTVNVKLEVEKKKEEETSDHKSCTNTNHKCCQCHSATSSPEDCPCLQKLSNSQLAALLRKQVEKRRDMTIKTRAKILATITHLIQELDNT